jgi:hypothetical protein
MLKFCAAISIKTAEGNGGRSGLEKSDSMDISKLVPQKDTKNASAAVTY